MYVRVLVVVRELHIRRLVPAPCLYLEHPINLLFEPLFVVRDVGGCGRLVTRDKK